ncbi:MAG TPA: hypothetical protein VG055_31690 [Planctomycetaceae bacterium]|jgi:hypothetical protein|nr:hypothetical protein [Planctomycetaceae bacterium]
MKAILAAVFLVGTCVGTAETAKLQSGEIAKRDARKVKAAQAELEKDTRLAKLTDAPPQKIGILTYYPNKGGGYTFVQGKDIVFYALPYTPSTYKCEVRVWQRVIQLPRGINPLGAGVAAMANVAQSINVPTIGPSKVPFGGQTICRTEMADNGKNGFYREDIRLAYWSRDTSDGKFQLWILPEDNETRLKLKSIRLVLEHAEHGR